MKKIGLVASIYHIWKERNNILFKKRKNRQNKVIMNIFEDIRLKFIEIKNGYLGFNNEVRRKWGIPIAKDNG